MPADPTAPQSPARVQAEDLDEESQPRSEGLVKSLKAVRIKREGGSRAGSGSATPLREGSNRNSPANGVSKSVKSEPGSPDATNGEPTDSEERIKDEKVKGEKVDDEKKYGASVVANGKKTPRSPILWLDAPSATAEAKEKFEEITHSIYINKRIGDADQDGEIMTCECKEEWDGTENQACGEDSDCINRVTRMECMIDGCGCGEQCQNTRFQRRQYADVSVIKADKKGFGLRADSFIPENTFIYEYVGEVIDEIRFRKRMDLYDKAGIKHFYFMSLKAGEFIDATKKGGLGRFCNHSCNPNCYVDKWVVGDKLRMGIFAKRDIIKGEELVFDYNVDRYGADPQPCYCGEPNCVGYIGGKTQTDAGPRLSHHVIEALGLEDDSVIIGKPKARKPRKTGEADSEYLAAAPIRQLKEKDVTKVMSTLVHCQERWIVHKLLSRIHNSTDESVYPRVMRLHGYQILGRILHEFKTDDSIIMMCLDILMQFPRVTKNKITSSKIEPTVHDLADTSTDPSVQEKASALLQVWSELETAFRIPKRAPTSKPLDGDQSSSGARTPNSNSKSKSRSKSPDRPIPTGPKGYKSTPPTGPNSSSSSPAHGFIPNGPRRVGPPPFPLKPRDLPWGWHRNFCSIQQQTYFWANDGSVTWWKPSMPCDAPKRLKPPPPPIYPYVALEREPLPETIRQMEKAAREKIEAKKREEREKVERERRERENLERLRKEEEERIKREEAEKEERKKRKEERKEWEKKQRVIKLEESLRKTLTAICGKYVVRYQDRLGGHTECKKWNERIVKILVQKSLKQQPPNADPKRVCKKLYERDSLDKIKAFCSDHCERVIEKNSLRLGRERKPGSGTPTDTPRSSETPGKKMVDVVEARGEEKGEEGEEKGEEKGEENGEDNGEENGEDNGEENGEEDPTPTSLESTTTLTASYEMEIEMKHLVAPSPKRKRSSSSEDIIDTSFAAAKRARPEDVEEEPET